MLSTLLTILISINWLLFEQYFNEKHSVPLNTDNHGSYSHLSSELVNQVSFVHCTIFKPVTKITTGIFA